MGWAGWRRAVWMVLWRWAGALAGAAYGEQQLIPVPGVKTGLEVLLG